MLEEWMVTRFEARTCQAATVVCTVNHEDASDLVQRYRLVRSPQIVPIWVDLSRVSKRERDPGGQGVGFFGNKNRGANLGGAQWVVDSVLPKVVEKIP